MSIKISELPSASTVASSDVIPIVQGATTKKATVGTILPAIATSITSSSTNDEVAGAQAVYNFTPKITYSTTDLTAGTSPLETGTFYFVYE